MNEQVFFERRDSDWKRLFWLCDKAEKSPKKLTSEEVTELVRLYRLVSTDLAVVRTQTGNEPLVEFLNDLSGRAYSLIYRDPGKPILQALSDNLNFGVQSVRELRWFIGSSALLFFLAGAASFLMITIWPQTRGFFIVPGFEDAFAQWKTGTHTDATSSSGLNATGFYLSNNPMAALMTGAASAGTFGFVAIFSSWSNGSMLGALVHEVTPLGHLGFLLSSIAPHGVPEIGGFFMAGGAGLSMGYAMIRPGEKSRGEALAKSAKPAVAVLVLAIIHMIVAAPIEGFFSFNALVPGEVKVLVATVLFIALWLFYKFYATGLSPRSANQEKQPKI